MFIQHNLCHCIRKIDAVVQACIVLDDGGAAIGRHHHQTSRVDRGRSIPLGRDVQDMDRGGRFTGHMNISAVLEETGIQCREGILVKRCMPGKIGLDLLVAITLKQRRHGHAGARLFYVGKRRRIGSVDKDQAYRTRDKQMIDVGQRHRRIGIDRMKTVLEQRRQVGETPVVLFCRREIQSLGTSSCMVADRRQPAFRLDGFTEQQLLETLFFASGFCHHGHAAALSQS